MQNIKDKKKRQKEKMKIIMTEKKTIRTSKRSFRPTMCKKDMTNSERMLNKKNKFSFQSDDKFIESPCWPVSNAPRTSLFASHQSQTMTIPHQEREMRLPNG